MAILGNIVDDIDKNGVFSFSRSGGPGGQNVNKVNTNVLLTMRLDDFSSLTEEERNSLREKLPNRINSEDEIYVKAQQERSQLRNRGLAVKRMTELVFNALKTTPARKKTKPSRAAKQRRLNDKKRRSELKKNRAQNDYS